MMYPTPTVWSSHVYIALDEAGTAGIDALLDEDIQRLAWESMGSVPAYTIPPRMQPISGCPVLPRN